MHHTTQFSHEQQRAQGSPWWWWGRVVRANSLVTQPYRASRKLFEPVEPQTVLVAKGVRTARTTEGRKTATRQMVEVEVPPCFEEDKDFEEMCKDLAHLTDEFGGEVDGTGCTWSPEESESAALARQLKRARLTIKELQVDMAYLKQQVASFEAQEALRLQKKAEKKAVKKAEKTRLAASDVLVLCKVCNHAETSIHHLFKCDC